MKGNSTKISKKKLNMKIEANWILNMLVSEESNLIPNVIIYGNDSSETMNILNTIDNILIYQVI